VAESGLAGSPRILQVGLDGTVLPILSGDELSGGTLLAPISDVTWAEGLLWVAHRQTGVNGWTVGAISILDPDDPQTFRTVVSDLPGAGDYSVGDIARGPDGMMYFSIGSATNTLVVGPDNELVTGWLAQAPAFRDFPAMDVALSGVEYETDNPLTQDEADRAVTAPYMPFDSGPVDAAAVIRAPRPDAPVEGIVAGNSAVYRIDVWSDDPATSLRLVAWGLRDPAGLAFDPEGSGELHITNDGVDIRAVAREGSAPGDAQSELVESRPIAGDGNDLFVLDVTATDAAFYGFPDFFHDADSGEPVPVTDPAFCDAEAIAVEMPCPGFVLDETTRDQLAVEAAVAQFEPYSAVGKLDISATEVFGTGDLFVALAGSVIPVAGTNELVGYKIVQVDGETHEVRDFIGAGATQDEIFDPEGLNKPMDVKFRGDEMLIVDFGVLEPGLDLREENTGKLWIVRSSEGGEQQETGGDGKPDHGQDGTSSGSGGTTGGGGEAGGADGSPY